MPIERRREYDPGAAFAVVMATGIVAIAAAEQGLPTLSDALLSLALAIWIVLAAGTAFRVLTNTRDASTARPQLQAFALVAATAVIGSRLAQAGERPWGLCLWALAVALWLLLLLRRPVVSQARGSSLLVVVATESLAVLAALLADAWGRGFVSVALAGWLLGLAVYPLVIALIVRAARCRRRFDPDLWIVMGALAVATLAGSELLHASRAQHTLAGLNSWLPDITLATWACASALIGILLVLELRTRSGWHYEPSRWSFVFPLGMYAVATRAVARADALPQLDDLASVFFVIGLAAWALALVGLSRHALR